MDRQEIREAEEKMCLLAADKDTEKAHLRADELLTELLTQYGGAEVQKIVDLYNWMRKWYG